MAAPFGAMATACSKVVAFAQLAPVPAPAPVGVTWICALAVRIKRTRIIDRIVFIVLNVLITR